MNIIIRASVYNNMYLLCFSTEQHDCFDVQLFWSVFCSMECFRKVIIIAEKSTILK